MGINPDLNLLFIVSHDLDQRTMKTNCLHSLLLSWHFC